MSEDVCWQVILADKVRDLVQQFGVEPFQAQLLEWKAVYDAQDMAATTYEREKQECLKRAWKDPRLRDSSAGAPEEGYVWACGSFDTEEGHILAEAWVPEALGDDACPEDPILPLPLPDRLLNLHEEYAVLAAIHDRYSPSTKISPWPDDWDETFSEDEYQVRRPEMKNAMLYWLLCEQVSGISDVGRLRLELIVGRVMNDLTAGFMDPPRDGSRTYAEWPLQRAETEVKKYLKSKQADYDELLPACLNEHRESIAKFRELFGPTAITDSINARCKIVEESKKCKKQNVSRTATYKQQIQPLFKNPPQPPFGWKPSEDGSSPFSDELARVSRETS